MMFFFAEFVVTKSSASPGFAESLARASGTMKPMGVSEAKVDMLGGFEKLGRVSRSLN